MIACCKRARRVTTATTVPLNQIQHNNDPNPTVVRVARVASDQMAATQQPKSIAVVKPQPASAKARLDSTLRLVPFVRVNPSPLMRTIPVLNNNGNKMEIR